MPKKAEDQAQITYYGTRSDWEDIKNFFGTFSNGVRILARAIRNHPQELRKLTDEPRTFPYIPKSER